MHTSHIKIDYIADTNEFNGYYSNPINEKKV
jgi:hypothetical protein